MFAGLLGFALGGSFVWGLQPLHPVVSAQHASAEQQNSDEHAKEKADEAIARYTFWLTVFTAVLAVATVGLGVATVLLYFAGEKQIGLARADLVANYRPRLRIRNIVAKPYNSSLFERMGVLQPGKPLGGQLYVVNIGGTKATITNGLCVVFWRKHHGLPMERPYEGRNADVTFPRIRLEAGQSTPVLFESDEPLPQDLIHLRIFVMGWVEYLDEVGIRRRTAFCQEYGSRTFGESPRFYPVDDGDYDHEE